MLYIDILKNSQFNIISSKRLYIRPLSKRRYRNTKRSDWYKVWIYYNYLY